MKMRKKVAQYFLIAAAWLPLGAWGQTETIAPERPDTIRVNLSQALELAMNQNATIKMADKEIERTDYARLAAMGGLFPALSANAQYSRSVVKPVMFLPDDSEFGAMIGGKMEVGMDNSLVGGVSASLPLVAPALWKNISVSKTDLDIALEKSRSSRIEMINQVKKSYYSAILAVNSYQVLQKSLQIAIDNYKNVKTMYEQGMVAEYDFIRADIRVRNLKPSLVQMELSLQMTNMLMKVLLSVPQEVVLLIDGSLTDYEASVMAEEVPQSFSLDNNTDLTQIELNLTRLNQQRQMIRAQGLPSLAAFASYQPQAQANDGKKLNWAHPFSAGVQLSIPIFKGLSVHYQERQARVGIDQLELQKTYLRDNISVQVRNALNSMMTAKEQIESNKLNVKQAQKGLNIAQTRYQTGAGTILELNDSDMALTQAELNYHQSIFDYLQSKADYEKLLGNQ